MISLTKRLCQSSISSRLGALQVHTNAEIVANSSFVRNRNPRNLELMRIARKPAGFRLEKPGREFWHKLVVTRTTRHVIAEIIHFENKTVVSASTKEWPIKKQLYKLQDRAAYLNLGRVLARRCLESGIQAVRCDIDGSTCEKLQLLINEMVNGGVSLEEPKRYIKAGPWDWHRMEKPWEVQE